MFLNKGYFWVFATALFLSSETNSQTHITPLIGMDFITIYGPQNQALTSSAFFETFQGKPIPTPVAGLDAENKINDNLHLYYGVKYLPFSTGYRRYHSSWGPDPSLRITFKNLSQNLGVLFDVLPNIRVGLALNLDYIFDFELKSIQPGTRAYSMHYPSLLDLGINLNLRYMWKNWVLKVDYNHGIHGFRNTSEDTPHEKKRRINPLKGFGIYVGYRFYL